MLTADQVLINLGVMLEDINLNAIQTSVIPDRLRSRGRPCLPPSPPQGPAIPRRRGGANIELMMAHVEDTWGSCNRYLQWLGPNEHAISAIKRRLLPSV